LQNIAQRVVLPGTLALLLVLYAGCGSGSGAGTVTGVTISPTTASDTLNHEAIFTANVTIAGASSTNSTNTAVTWYVNGINGGNATVGTISVDANNPEQGDYVAPGKVPGTATCGTSGQVCITASAQKNPNGTAGGGANSLVTSNTAVLTIGTVLGLEIIAPPSTVPAGGTVQFNAQLNGITDINATWSVSSANGGNVGTITNVGGAGLYSAPNFPPPGDTVTITASDSSTGNTVTATATVSITYSDMVLNGAYAFSYAGNDSSGFLGAAGSFVANGAGGIIGGIEDISSFQSGITTSVQIKNTSTYIVKADGRGIATLNTSVGTETIAFALTTNEHAILTRFDSTSTGSGTLEAQDLNALGGDASVISGPYVLSAMGLDMSFNPEAMAGEFTASRGTISAAGSLLDIHDGATSSAAITTNANLTSDSQYAFDSANAGTGRGTLTLNTPLGPLEFAFYIVDSTELYLVEIDGTSARLCGEVLAANTSAPGLTAANYVMTAGGAAWFVANSETQVGAYAAGAVFVSGRAGTVSSGSLDENNHGSVTADQAIGSCPYSVNPTAGRVVLELYVGTGSCPASPSTSLHEFVMYPFATSRTTQPQNFVLLEVDLDALSTGVAYKQTSTSTPDAGGFALGLAGQGLAHASRPPSAQNVDGDFTDIGGSTGNLDVNFFAPYSGDPLTSAAFGTVSSTGRGTLPLTAKSPAVSYDLILYMVNGDQALLFDQDQNSSLVLTGIVERQF
jgi:hypothetical protein